MTTKIPGTAREIIENLINSKDYSIKQIAQKLGISTKTVYRIRKGLSPHPRTHLNLIQLFLNLRQTSLQSIKNNIDEETNDEERS